MAKLVFMCPKCKQVTDFEFIKGDLSPVIIKDQSYELNISKSKPFTGIICKKCKSLFTSSPDNFFVKIVRDNRGKILSIIPVGEYWKKQQKEGK